MSTKTQSNSSGNQNTAFQFSPAGMNNYKLFQQALGNILPGFINNPFNNPQFQLEQAMGQQQATQLGQRGMSNIMNNMRGMGFGNMPGFQQSLLASQGRATQGAQSNAWRQGMLTALQRQQYGLGVAASYQPLMTGSNMNYAGQQTQTTSGLGTWLPQLAGSLGSAAMNAFMPGAGSLMGAVSGGGGGGGGMSIPNPGGGGGFMNLPSSMGPSNPFAGMGLPPGSPTSYGSH